jgi:uncharacterized membrane protein
MLLAGSSEIKIRRKKMNYKQQGKDAMQPYFWLSVGIMVLYAAISSAASQFYVVGTIFVSYPLLVGVNNYFIALHRDGHGEFDDVFKGFRQNFVENAITLFLMQLYTMLWALLLIIPGIVKGIGYSMTAYILADDDFEVTYNDAIKTSSDMMMGRKMDYFMLALSFIGWILLGILTLGILYIWLLPYMQSTFTAFYLDVKQSYLGTSNVKEAFTEEKTESWDL